MSAITRFFFRNEVTCRSTADVIGWWETRRLPFNAAIGATGVFSYAAVQLVFLMPPRPMPIPFVPSVVIALAYGVLANICYTGGWWPPNSPRSRARSMNAMRIAIARAHVQ